MTSATFVRTHRLDWEQCYKLSRFAILRPSPSGSGFVAETPFSKEVVAIANAELLKLLFALTGERVLTDVVDGIPPVHRPVVERLLVRCVDAGLLVRVGDDGPSDETGALQTWEVHDLYFHTRSRSGRTPFAVGGTYRFEGDVRPLPITHAVDGEPIRLCAPDLDTLATADVSLTEAMERRRSTRRFAGALPLRDLGELLYRTCRVDAVVDSQSGGMSKRPYPSGGACYPLDVYAVAAACDGLEPGIYHYDPVGHALRSVADLDGRAETLLDDARDAMNGDGHPPVLLCIAARFARTAWKYQSIAYALILKEVGVLYQSLWLAAAAMNLGACGLGTGNADLFADLVGTDYFAQTTVGEFAVGPMAGTE